MRKDRGGRSKEGRRRKDWEGKWTEERLGATVGGEIMRTRSGGRRKLERGRWKAEA